MVVRLFEKLWELILCHNQLIYFIPTTSKQISNQFPTIYSHETCTAARTQWNPTYGAGFMVVRPFEKLWELIQCQNQLIYFIPATSNQISNQFPTNYSHEICTPARTQWNPTYCTGFMVVRPFDKLWELILCHNQLIYLIPATSKQISNQFPTTYSHETFTAARSQWNPYCGRGFMVVRSFDKL